MVSPLPKSINRGGKQANNVTRRAQKREVDDLRSIIDARTRRRADKSGVFTGTAGGGSSLTGARGIVGAVLVMFALVVMKFCLSAPGRRIPTRRPKLQVDPANCL